MRIPTSPRARLGASVVLLFLPLAGALADAPAEAADAAPNPSAAPSAASATPDTRSAESLPQVIVTGSRIPRATVEGPSPVIVIDGAAIDRQGFRNAYDAISSLSQNTGTVQGEDFGNTFTAAANTINLRGLGPNHSLVLINGRRVADYPIAYEGSVNFVNLANIPSAMIDRIEVLGGGASAIYGSDAVAGVVNIILKRRVDELAINLRLGGTEEGGGANRRLQLIGGKHWGALEAVLGIELADRQPIWGTDRDFMDSYLDNPNPDTVLLPTATFYRSNARTGRYFDPGEGTCEALGDLYNGTLVRAQSARYGYYCGSPTALPTYWTVQTGKRNVSAFGAVRYPINDQLEWFADLMIGVDRIRNNTRPSSWTSAGNYFYNETTSTYEKWYRRLAPEEIGGREQVNAHYFERSWNISTGVNGSLADGDWAYEIVANRSEYANATRRRTFLAGLDEFFLGPRLGDRDGIPVYAPNPARLFTALTPAEYKALTGHYTSHNDSSTQNVSASINGELFALPGGNAGFAAVAEVGTQSFANEPDPRLGNGTFWNTSAGIIANGSRDRFAAGAELKLPLWSRLTVSTAGRYDEYRFAGREDGKFTYNLGLEFRPHDTVLLRGNYATSFRAPDMNYIFAPETRGYNPGMTDYYRCRLANQPYDDCDYNGLNINYTSRGTADLKSENGESFGFGAVWSPSAEFDLSADYYNIDLSDQVTNLSSSGILRDEADCRMGQTLGGEARDIHSALCQDALARVLRNPPDANIDPNAVQRVLINPINAATERTAGVDVKANYRLETDHLGKFRFGLGGTFVISHKYRQFSTDEYFDYRNSLNSSNWRSKVDGTISWSIGAWNANLYALRYGTISNNYGTGRIAPVVRYNGSVGYQVDKNLALKLAVNNIRNSRPPVDTSGWPFYFTGNYNPYGRQVWVEIDYRLGRAE
ncbi:TonB-dependent receptor plug domain-containing protein [Tahibacter amnicola]|uniref:TonB-dependent receptor n=1 Tax=Tahibacter amnicola TaxID=2976241 RepID=A0ABY6BGW4_9GAMM|nr:TonB-dependent receptor [Tahibacter amnicola]UXI68315.1 TonB-dependent receptor [Tahibacter amnicola]